MDVFTATRDSRSSPSSIVLMLSRNSKIGAGKEFKFDVIMTKTNQVVQCHVGCEAFGICHSGY